MKIQIHGGCTYFPATRFFGHYWRSGSPCYWALLGVTQSRDNIPRGRIGI